MARWEALLPGTVALGRELVNRYGRPTRAYHNLNHLAAVLSNLDLLADEADDMVAVELAAWFHDAVYDVRAEDNEGESAALAAAVLPTYDVPADLVDEVCRLVRLTARHDPEEWDANGRVLCDADLAILASPEPAYDDYVDAVRAEYHHVTDREFRAGRAAVLRQLDALPTLFRTAYGQKHWEQPARANLARELAELEGH
jgi:predicted metal-dependent HD superfamily phosphohydrolase